VAGGHDDDRACSLAASLPPSCANVLVAPTFAKAQKWATRFVAELRWATRHSHYRQPRDVRATLISVGVRVFGTGVSVEVCGARRDARSGLIVGD
jgi:NO-binding membrane sensor protein with MHYT domain